MANLLDNTLPDGLSAVAVRVSTGVVAVLRSGLSNEERARVIREISEFEVGEDRTLVIR